MINAGNKESGLFQQIFAGLALQSNYFKHSLVPLVGQFFTIQPHIENLRPILDEEPKITDDKIDVEVLTGEMKVSDLTFSYGEKLPDVLKDVSFEISAGENVATIGKSSCGKSTLSRLLLGFEKPRKGAIYFDDQDLASFSLPSVRSQMRCTSKWSTYARRHFYKHNRYGKFNAK